MLIRTCGRKIQTCEIHKSKKLIRNGDPALRKARTKKKIELYSLLFKLHCSYDTLPLSLPYRPRLSNNAVIPIYAIQPSLFLFGSFLSK